MNAALIANNDKLCHQTEGVSELLDQENIKLSGNYGEGPAIDSILDGTFQFLAGLSDSTIDFLRHVRMVLTLLPQTLITQLLQM